MPVVKVTLAGNGARESVIQSLQENLQRIVADALSVPGVENAKLVPEDVELEFENANPYNVGKELHILVLANWFEERARNVQSRSTRISAEVSGLLKKEEVHGFVYVRLSEAGFSEF